MSLLHGIANFLPNRRTRLIVPAVALGIVIVALFTPSDESGNSMDGRLSSFLSGPNGAKGFHDAAKRLGWRTERKKISPFDSIPAGTIVAVLAPPQELSERETGILLQNVRAGASLLTVVTSGSALADSLNLVPARGMIDLPVILPVNPHCRAGEPRSAYQLMGDKTFVTPFSKPTRLGPGSQAFVMVRDVDDSRLTRFAAIGFPLEKGRVVAVSDANVMRNDFIRVCKWGIGPSTIQMLQFLSNGRQPADTRLIFDEFHLGFGPQPSVARAAGRVLFGTAPGATLVQIIVAAGILLLAVAPRPLPPSAPVRVQRRSPFEHVEALSAAYCQISATRVVTERLVRGLRRRLASASSSGSQGGTDAAFLDKVSHAYPQVAAEVTAVATALTRQSSPAQLLAVGEAIETIERTITL